MPKPGTIPSRTLAHDSHALGDNLDGAALFKPQNEHFGGTGARLEPGLVYFDLIIYCKSVGQIFYSCVSSRVSRSLINLVQPRAIRLIYLKKTQAKPLRKW